MIYGKTNDTRIKEYYENDRKLKEWHPFFVLRPKYLNDGRKAWLCWVERRIVDKYYAFPYVKDYEYRVTEIKTTTY